MSSCSFRKLLQKKKELRELIRWRAERLVEKLLSVKFVIFVVATVLKCLGIIGGGEWLTVAMAVIAGREIQKFKNSGFELFGSKKDANEESLGSD